MNNFLLLLVFGPSFSLSSLLSENDVIFSAIASALDNHDSMFFPSEVINDDGTTPQVQTEMGHITGRGLPEAHGFFSVPYAEPPVGEKRFQRTRLLESFPDMKFNADVINRLACFQTSQENINGLELSNLSEDCLVLNIHVPKSVALNDPTATPTNKLPVLVWLHGGGFQTGSGTSSLYDGRYLSNVTNTIVVSINYRLGPFGFLAFKNENGLLCNQGFHDQQLALEWINKHIHNFGGDKNRVTLVGQSAGAQAAMFHLMSSKSAPFFHRAVISSMPAILQYPSFEEAFESTKFVLNVTDCEEEDIEQGLLCLRNLTSEVLVQLRIKLMLKNIKDANLLGAIEPFGMVLDGEEFIENPIQFVQNGRWKEDTRFIILGSTIEEMNHIQSYIPQFIQLRKTQFENLLKFVFGNEMGADIAEKYDSMYDGPRKNYFEILAELVTDGFFVCPIRALARLTSEFTTTYLYSFAHRMSDPSCEKSWTPGSICDYVYHSSDNVFLFKTSPLVPYNFSENDTQASDQISYYWGNFASLGSPSSGDVERFPDWPQYSENSALQQLEGLLKGHFTTRDTNTWINLVIESPSGNLNNNYKDDICNFWDNTKYYVDLDQNGATTSTKVTQETLTNTPPTTSGATHALTTEHRQEETTSSGGARSLSLFLFSLSSGIICLLVLCQC